MQMAEPGDRQARRMCFTIHGEENLAWLKANYTSLHNNVQFVIFQIEKAPETGALHAQGYLELKKPAKYSTVQGYMECGQFHIEVCGGSQEDNIKYCTKEETRVEGPFEHGERKRQGERMDLIAAHALLKEGRPVVDVVDAFPAVGIRFVRNLKEVHAMYHKPTRRQEPTILFMSGPPGIGKSRLADNIVAGAGMSVFRALDNEQGWFDGYDGEEIVLFDEFRGLFPLRLMLQLLDFYALRLPVKGGFVGIKAHTFIFTSNLMPNELYGADPAWMSRITPGRFTNVKVLGAVAVKAAYSNTFGSP